MDHAARARETVRRWFKKQWPNSSNLDPHRDCDYKKLTKEIEVDSRVVEAEALEDASTDAYLSGDPAMATWLRNRAAAIRALKDL